jgi:hypothetical protein
MDFNREISKEELDKKTETVEIFLEWVQTAPRKDLEAELRRCYLSSLSRYYDRQDALYVLDQLKMLLD